VAIVQVSRITQRKGLQEDLPQPLASAELGWAVDQRRLFIGNGTLAEGAPVVGNTEILTEFSDILSFDATYAYKGEAAGYTVQTGSSPGTPVTTSLQSRLDYFVSVKAFGATGDGVTDDTNAINRALYQLFCVQTNSQVRRSLFFPAGTYKITSALLVPSYCLIYGEGPSCSQLSFYVNNWVSGTPYDFGDLVKYSGLYYRALENIPAGTTTTPDTPSSGWAAETLSNYVIQTADSLQQTGANIGTNGATPPTRIEIYKMGISTNQYGTGGHDILLLDRCNEICFEDVDFTGPLNSTLVSTTTADQSCVRITSTSALPVSMVSFNRCKYQNTTYAFKTDNATNGITLSNGWFDTHYQAIVLGDSSPVDGGPVGFRIVQNTFDNVYAEAVVIDSVSYNASAYNTYLNVGNQLAGNTPTYPVISINANNNVSVGDLFQRTQAEETQYNAPRVKVWNSSTGVPSAIALTNGELLTLGSYNRQSGLQTTLTDNDTQTLFSVDTTIERQYGGFCTFVMDYVITRQISGSDTASRRGRYTVVSAPDDFSTPSSWTINDDDTSVHTTDLGVTFSASISSGIIDVDYTTTSLGYDATIYYSINYLG